MLFFLNCFFFNGIQCKCECEEGVVDTFFHIGVFLGVARFFDVAEIWADCRNRLCLCG